MSYDLAASIAITNKNNVWINDNMATKCRCCQVEFGYFKRKHHCRNCGNIFCYTCSNYYAVIPDFITDRPDPADYWNMSYYITSLKAEEVRVCKQCFDQIKEKTIGYEKILNIFNDPISIDKIKALSDSSIDIKNHYFDQLRNIQYYLPNHKYSDIDKKLLKINAPYFSKHSKYLVHLIKSMDWNISSNIISPHVALTRTLDLSVIENANTRDLQFIISVVNGEKTKKCNELYCTRTCQEQLSCDDCVNILYSCVNSLPDQLIEYLFSIVMDSPEQVILCHLSFLITLVKNNTTNKLLQTLLFNLLNRSQKMIYHTYWFLNNAKETANEQEMRSIKSFIELFDIRLIKQIHREYMFFVGLINNLEDPKKYLANEFDRYKPISLPYEPTFKLVSVDLESIVIKSSYTRPVIISFGLREFPNAIINETDKEETDVYTEKIKLLFKKESVMNDVAVLNLTILLK